MDQYDFQAEREKERKKFFSDAKFTPETSSPELSKPALDFRSKVLSAVQSLTKPSQRKRNTIFKNGCLLIDQEIEPPNVEEPSFSIDSYLRERSGIPMDHALNILNEAENRLAEAQQRWAHDELPGIVHAAEHPDDREDKEAYQAAVRYNYGDPLYGDPRTIACDITERWYRSIAGELADSATEGLAEEMRSIIGTWGRQPTDVRIDDLLARARTAWMDAISKNLRRNFLAGTISNDSTGDRAKPADDDNHFALRGTPRARARVHVWIRNYALALEATHQEIDRNGSDWRILLSKTRDVCNALRKRFPGRGQEETGDNPDVTSLTMERDTMSVAYSAMIASITPLCNTSVAPDGKRAAAVFLDQHGDLTQTAVVSSIVRYAIKPDRNGKNLVGGDVPARPQLVLAWLNLHGAIRETVPMKDKNGKIVTNDDGKVRRTTQYRFPDIAGGEDTPQQDGAADDDTNNDDVTPAYDRVEDNVSSGSYTRSTIYDTMRVIYAWMQSQHPDIGIPAHPSRIFAPDWRGCKALQAAFATMERGVDPQSSAFDESLYRYYALAVNDPKLQTLSNPKRTVVNSYIKAAKAMMRMLYLLGGLGGCTFDSIAMIDVHIDAIEHPASVNVKGRIDASLKIVLFAALATGWTHDPWGSVVGRVRPGLWHHYLDPHDPDTDGVQENTKILPSTTELKGVEDVDRAVRIINGRKRDPLTYTATTLVRVNQSDADAASGTSPAKPPVKNSKVNEETEEQRHRRVLQLRRDLALHAAEHVICDAQRANLWDAARYAASVDIPGGPDEWSGHDMNADDYLAGMRERKPYCIGSLNGKVCNYE